MPRLKGKNRTEARAAAGNASNKQADEWDDVRTEKIEELKSKNDMLFMWVPSPRFTSTRLSLECEPALHVACPRSLN